MANTLINIMHKILAGALSTLRERAIMPRLVNSSFSTEAARKGETIDVPIPTAVSVSNVAPASTPPTPTDTTPDLVQVPLDQWKKSDPFYLTDKDMVEVDKNEHFLPMQVGEAVKALANTINIHLHAQYQQTDRGIFGYHGTAGTTPFGSDVKGATQSRKILHQQLCPREDRRGVVDFDAEAQMLELSAFSDAEKIGGSTVKLQGEIGEKFGILWAADDHVATHTAGAFTTGTPITSGTAAIGTDTVTIDDTAFTGTVENGDIISFAGHTQTYCVIDNAASPEFAGAPLGTYTAAANQITLLKFFPKLKTAVADAEAITLRATHVLNLIFHRDAFAFAMRPLMGAIADVVIGSRLATMQDPVTGLVLRLEVSRQYKQTVWELDALYGAQLVRAELAMRLAG